MPGNTQEIMISQLEIHGKKLDGINESLKALIKVEERQHADSKRIRSLELENHKDKERIHTLELVNAKESGRDAVVWPWVERAMAILVFSGVLWIVSGGKVSADEFYIRGGFGIHPDLTANLPEGWGTSDYNDRVIGHVSFGYRSHLTRRIKTYIEAEHVSDPRWKDPGAGLNWVKIGLEKSW